AKRTVGGGTAYNVELGVKKALLNLPLTVAEFTANVFGRDVQKMDYLSGIADSMSPKSKAEYVGFAIGSGVGALAEIKVISGLLRMAQVPRFAKLMGKGGDAILKNSKASSIIHKAFPLILNERSAFDAILFTALASYHTYAKEKRFITGKELLGSAALGYAFPKGIKFEGLGTSNLALVGRVAGTFGIGAGLGAGEALYSLGHLPKDAHEKMSIIEAGMTMAVFACSPIFHKMKMVGSNLVTNMKKNADVYTIDKISKETGKKYKDVSEEFFSESKDDYFAVRDGDFVHAKRIDPKLANQPGYITVNDVIVKAPAYYKYLNKYTNKLKFELQQHYEKLYKKGVITIQDYINLITPSMTREQINDILRADNINVKNVEKSKQKEITVAKNKFKKVVIEASKEKFKLAEAEKRVAEAEKDLIDTLELINVDYSNNYEAKLKDAQDKYIERFWDKTSDKYVNRVFGPKYVAAIKAAGLQTKISAEDLIVRPDEIRQDPYTGEFRVEKQLKGKEVPEVEPKKETAEKEVKEEELDVSDVGFNNQRVDELNKYITNLGDNAVDFVADANILETIKKYSDKSVIIGVNKLLNDYKKLRNVENFEVLYKDLNEAVNKLFTEYENIKKFVTEKASDVVFREKEMEKKLFELEQESLEREGEVPLEEREVVTLKKKPVEGTEIENVIDKIDIEKKPKEKKKLTQEEAITKLKTMLGEDLEKLDDYFPFGELEVTKTDKQENFKDRDQIKEFNYDDKIYKEAFFPKIKKAWQAAKGDDISLLHFCATVLDVYTRKWRQYVAKFYNENFNEEYGNVKIKDTTPIWGKDEQGNKIRILARADTKNKIIHVDKKLVTAHFKGKNEYIEGITDTIWTRGKHGVENLYPDTFKTVKDFMNFVIEHEKTHFEQTVKDIKNKALRENVANYIALEMLGLKVPHQLESIALGHLINVKYGKGYDLNKIVRTINNYNKIIKLTPDQIAYKYNVDVDKIKDIFKKAGNFEKFSELIGNEVEKLSDSEKRSMYWTFSNARYGGLFGIGKDGKLYEYSEKDFRLEIPIDRIFSAKEFRIYNGDNREKNKGIMSQDVVDKLFKNGEIPYSPRGEGERWYVFKISKNILEMSDDGIRDKFNNEQVFESAKKYVGNNVKQMRIELARKEIHDKIFGSQANNIAGDVFETLKRVKIAVTPNKRILSELLGRKNFTLGIINHENSPFSKDIADGGSYILPETVNEIFKTHGIDSKIGGFKPIGYFTEGNDVLFTKTYFNSPPPEMAKFMRDNGIEILEFESAAKVRGGRFKNLIDVEVSDNDVITSRDMKDKIQNVPVESFGVLYAEQLDLVGNPSVSTQIGNLILRHPDAISPAKIIDKLIETFVQPEIDNYRKFIIDKDNIKKLTEWLLKTIDPSDRYSASEFGSLDNIPQKDFIKFLENNGNPLTDRRYSEILKQIINKQLIRNITHPRGVGGTFPASPDLFKRLEYKEVFVAKSMQEIGTSIGDRVLIVKIPAGQVEGILVGTVKGFLHESQGNTAQVSSKWFVEKIGNDYDADAIQIIVNAPKELLDYFGNHPYKGIEYGTVDNKAVYGDVCKSFYHLPSVIKIHNVLLQSKKDIGFTASFSRLYSFLYNSKFKIQIGNNVYDMNNHTEQQLRDNLKYFNSILQSNVDALKVGPIRFNKDEAMRRVFEKTDGGKIPQEDFDIIKVVVNNLSSKLGIFSKNYSINSEGETFTLVELFKRIEGYKYFVNAMRGIIPENQFNPLFHNGNTQKEHRSFRTGEKPSKALAAARHYSSMFAEGKIKVSFEQGNTFYEGIVKAMSEGGIDKHFGAIDNTQKLWREDGSAYIPNKSKRFIGYDKQIMQVDGIKKQEAIESACEGITIRQLEDVLYKNISFEKQNEIKNSINAYRELWGMFEWSGQEAGEKKGISEVGERDLIKNISTVLKMSVKEVESLLALDSKSFADIWKKQVLEFYGDLKKENKSFSILAQLLMRKPELKETVDRRYQHYNYKYEPKPASFLMDNNVEKLFNDLYNDIFSYVIAHKLSPQRELLNPNNPLYKGTASDFIIPSIEKVKEQTIEKVKEQIKTKGGFEDKGKGTSEGDGKDKAMREVADGFIGEIVEESSSSATSRKKINAKKVENPKIVMLARNKEFAGKDLKQETKNKILEAYKIGVKFVVGDMPNVDTQFIDYLQEIGAKFTVYHAGEKPRITVETKTVPIEKTEEEFSFKAEPETITL
nr:hypothetical protein [Bacteroidota bacterium]